MPKQMGKLGGTEETKDVMDEIHEEYMRRALQLARLGRGTVSPNPMVGAVIVRDGKIIGEGYHRRYGEGHAEVNAVVSVRDKSQLAESTIYVTLEPCSHYGKTPPCAKLIIDSGIPRVVVGALDPFEKVSGRGVEMLREAGVEVTTGVLEAECRELNKIFMTAHGKRRPFVMLKWAQSADGYIDRLRGNGEGAMVFSNAVSAMWMHRERAAFDAILVGAGTVRLDNPSLTVRRWTGRNPLRVVLDANLSIPVDSRLLTDGGPTLVYNRVKAKNDGAVEYVQMEGEGLGEVLSDLYLRGVTSLMVEGGGRILDEFYSSGLWDEARVEEIVQPLGCGVPAPEIAGNVKETYIHGENVVKIYERCVKTL